VSGWLFPDPTPGILFSGQLRWVEHVAWVILEAGALIASCLQTQEEMRAIAQRHAFLEVKGEAESGAAASRLARQRVSDALVHISEGLRIPMNALRGQAHDLLDPHLSSGDRQNRAQSIRRGTEHLLAMLDDLLDRSRIEAGAVAVPRMPCSPFQIVGEVAELMRPRATAKKLYLAVEYAGPIPEVIVSSAGHVRQVLVSLLGNAIKFSSAGGVRLTVRCERPRSVRPRLLFTVVDSGAGMTSSELGEVFAPSAEDQTALRGFGNTGLRLGVCRRLARLLEGDLSLDSIADHGTCATLTVATGRLDGVQMVEGARRPIEPDEARPATPILRVVERNPMPDSAGPSLGSDLADHSDLADLVGRFVDLLPAQSTAVAHAAQAGDLAELERLVRRLKGAGGSFGYATITDAADRVEGAIRERQEIGAVRRHVDDLVALCGRVRSPRLALVAAVRGA
ncbi:MAG: hypothetical protein EXR72_25855, partial [Myxococcales bacterium]|nr:hypothetical protein [Myxococcales bacterium]